MWCVCVCIGSNVHVCVLNKFQCGVYICMDRFYFGVCLWTGSTVRVCVLNRF